MKIKSHQNKFNLASAVKEGLGEKPKWLPSWLFYDEQGDALFQQIMSLPEYYLTRCETEILDTFSKGIAYNLKEMSRRWNIVELGPGDGSKSLLLLKAFLAQGMGVEYYPIDISRNALSGLEARIRKELPDVNVRPVNADYTQSIQDIPKVLAAPTLYLFLGANIGNFELHEAVLFLHTLSKQVSSKDLLFVSFDLMKKPELIEKAYNDSKGITTAFNYNILERINRELGGNFDPSSFEHWPIYDPVTGACRSYLVCTREHAVHLEKIDMKIVFDAWEPIHTEISQKYNEELIGEVALASELRVERLLYDHKRYFTLAMMKPL